MGNFIKWIGAGLGFTLGGPIGSVLGLVVGSILGGFSKEDIENAKRYSASGGNVQSGDFEISLLLLSAVVIKADGKVDEKAFADFVNWQIEQGTDGLVPVGTTGQSATLSHKQHLEFIKFVVDYVDNRSEIIAGAGSNCTRESVEMITNIQKIIRFFS